MATRTFRPVPSELDFPKYEREILELWKSRRIFERSLEHRGPDAPQFVFYEGPPTANGMPHNGHVLTRVIKDLFPRYKAMCGYRVLRKGGWDTHGLPVEVEVEKELRIHGKEAIEAYGVAPFVRRCIESVFRYTGEWERLTERIGFWVSLPDAYVTYHRSFVESVWWALSELFEKGLLYRGHKVVWWWAQGGTALSSAEVGLGYKTVDDPSAYVLFPLRDASRFGASTGLVVWTTTPWTLPSNGYAAVRPRTRYSVVRVGEPLPVKEKGKEPKAAPALSTEQLIVASELVPQLAAKLGRELTLVSEHDASELEGLRYTPPFDLYAGLTDATAPLVAGGEDALWWRVIVEDFVTLDTGTGIVHIAPAFGEDDNRAHGKQLRRYTRPEDVALLCAIGPDGRFLKDFPKYAGRWVKDCDKELLGELRQRQLLVHDELYRHDYPFCWRSDEDPLIQLARPAWFIRTTAELDRAMANNQAVNWLPAHIKDGRFGDFLRNNVDWALSRERFWGTPLNVWQCPVCGQEHAPASVAAIERRNPKAFAHWYAAKAADPTLDDHLMVHKPWIDEVSFPCSADGCSGVMQRVPEVIDCWFDSGCMPFAQWGFPHAEDSLARFDDTFPADFISEAIDQTRGWFYSLLMVASLVFDEETQARLGLSRVRPLPLPYKSCIVLGHVCDKEGKKESKGKGNYTPPDIILDRVKLDFAVVDTEAVEAQPGVALIAREDLEGMDLEEGASLLVYRPNAPEQAQRLIVKAHKKLPRRVVVLPASVRAELAVGAAPRGLTTMPVEVPKLDAAVRVTLEDPATPAPGADAFRWFFYAASPPSSNTRHSLRNVRTFQKDFVVKLRNVFSFFVIYANIDGFEPSRDCALAAPHSERPLLDRWMASELELCVRDVRAALDNYDPYTAALRLVEVVEGLSNWYVRRSRARFWAPLEEDTREGAGEGAKRLGADKLAAYATLYDALTTLSKLVAPFIPFFAEELHQTLVRDAGIAGAPESVHLADYPVVREAHIDTVLSEEMAAVREIVSLGLSVRTANRLKVRQPLATAEVILNDGRLVERVRSHLELVTDELNVHEVVLLPAGAEQHAVSYKLKPNFRALGPKLGKNVQSVKKLLDSADASAFHAELARTGAVRLEVGGESLELSSEDVEVVVSANEGFAAETGKVGVVVLHTTLTDALIDEGLLRELVSRVQARRKDLGLEFTDRVAVTIDGSERVRRVAEAGSAHLASECLAARVTVGPCDFAETVTVGEEELRLEVERFLSV